MKDIEVLVPILFVCVRIEEHFISRGQNENGIEVNAKALCEDTGSEAGCQWHT